MSIQLIAIDIDGTLMPTSGPRIGDRTLAAVKAAEASGIEIVIATGRRQAFAMPLIAPIGLKRSSIIISSNGAVTRRLNGHLLHRHLLAASVARRLCVELRGYGTLVFTFDREEHPLVVENAARLHARLERWVDSNRLHLIEIDPIERAFDGPDEPIQGMVCGGLEEMRRAEENLREAGFEDEIAMHRTEYDFRELSILDLLPAGCSKGAALECIARERGLSPSQVMAIGDNLNDLDMLEYAGWPVVMANSSEPVLAIARERGWRIGASNDEEGVAQIVEELLRGRLAGIPPNGDCEVERDEDRMAKWAP